MRCPFCLDSKKVKNKARGYIYVRDQSFNYYCHNCGDSRKFYNLLKALDFSLYAEYKKDMMVHKHDVVTEKSEPVKPKPKAVLDLISLVDLPKVHPVVKYVRGRMIDAKYDPELFYAPKYMHWINEKIPGKFKEDILERDEPRLVLPLLDHDGTLFGSVGRAMDPKSDLRYNTVIFDEGKPKVYGLHRIDFNRKFFLVEGPIDSLFLDNALAAAGSDIMSAALKLHCDLSRAIFVFDNERRNSEICDKIKYAIDRGFAVCLWPDALPGKDINAMIQDGKMLPWEVQNVIETHTYRGLSAQLQFAKWKR